MNCLQWDKNRPRHDLALLTGFFSSVWGIGEILYSLKRWNSINKGVPRLPEDIKIAILDWLMFGFLYSLIYILVSLVLVHGVLYVSSLSFNDLIVNN